MSGSDKVLFNKNDANEFTKEEIWDDSALIEMYEQTRSLTHKNPQKSHAAPSKSTVDSGAAEYSWKVGDYCMAPYEEDGKYYPAKVVKIMNNKCEVIYTDYDTKAAVKLGDLLRELKYDIFARSVFSEEIYTRLLSSDILENDECNNNCVNLSEDDVDYADEDEASASEQQNISVDIATSSEKDNFGMPEICPPPPPHLFSQIAQADTDKEALTNMLMAWYMNGYHTGYYKGMQKGKAIAGSSKNS